MKKRTIVERPYEVVIEADGNILNGLSPVFGPKGTQAFFLGNTLYVQAGTDAPEEIDAKTIPSIRNNIYKDLPEVLTVDGTTYVAKKMVERRKGLEEPSVADDESQTADQEDEEQIEELLPEFVVPLAKSPPAENSSAPNLEAEQPVTSASEKSRSLEAAFKYVLAKLYRLHKQKDATKQGETQRTFDAVADDVELALSGNTASNCSENDAKIIIGFFNQVMDLKPEEDFMQALALFKDKHVKEFLPQFLRHLFYEITGGERVKLMDQLKETYDRCLSD